MSGIELFFVIAFGIPICVSLCCLIFAITYYQVADQTKPPNDNKNLEFNAMSIHEIQASTNNSLKQGKTRRGELGISQDSKTQDELKRKTLVVAEEMCKLACDKYIPTTDRIAAAEAIAILVQPILSNDKESDPLCVRQNNLRVREKGQK